jgi:hypothetical protein
MPLDEVEANGVIDTDTNAQVQALFPGSTVTPTANFNFPWNGCIVQFSQGMTQDVEPGLLAALAAAGASYSQP